MTTSFLLRQIQAFDNKWELLQKFLGGLLVAMYNNTPGMYGQFGYRLPQPNAVYYSPRGFQFSPRGYEGASQCKPQVSICNFFSITGDKNISILYLSCRMSEIQFPLVLQTHELIL